MLNLALRTAPIVEEQEHVADLGQRLTDTETRAAAALADLQLQREELGEERRRVAGLERRLGETERRGAAALALEQERNADLARRLRVATSRQVRSSPQAAESVPSQGVDHHSVQAGQDGSKESLEQRVCCLEQTMDLVISCCFGQAVPTVEEAPSEEEQEAWRALEQLTRECDAETPEGADASATEGACVSTGTEVDLDATIMSG
jgi:hypothetical protein